MVKILTGLIAALVIAAGGFFGFEFYVQHRVAGEVEAAFERIRAAGAKASHGKVSFDPWSRTVTIADIAAELAAQPPVSFKIGSFKASGVSQPNAAHFAAAAIEATDAEVGATMNVRNAPSHVSYKAPRIAIKNYSGPAGPQRPLDPSSAADVYRFALEHLAAVTAASVTAPSVVGTMNIPDASGLRALDYTYSNLALSDIKDGRIAAITIERANFTADIEANGKTEKLSGEFASMAAHDFDSAAAAAMFDPARGNDDKYYRVYRQIAVGPYSATLPMGARMRIDGMTMDDIELKPSKLQFSRLMALMPSAGAPPSPAQARELLEKTAGMYEGMRVGSAEMRGLSVETAGEAVKLAALRFNLENGKIGEFALEGLEARSPQGPVKLGRFALKSLDVANLLRAASRFSGPAAISSPEQLFGLLPLLEGADIKGVVAPYKDSTAPVEIDHLSLGWGQFIGPIPSQARLTLKMSVPVVAVDPAQQMLSAAGIDTAAISLDLGAAWTEGSRSFVLEPVMAELGGVLSASARVALANVPREVFSTNPLQAAFMATQIEAGTIEITLRDIGGVDLAVAQYARTQHVSSEEARRAIIDTINSNGTAMAATSPDAKSITDALTRFIEDPRGTLNIKLTPQGKVSAMQLAIALRSDPLGALARFQVEASTGR